jgi:hypothetical protein
MSKYDSLTLCEFTGGFADFPKNSWVSNFKILHAYGWFINYHLPQEGNKIQKLMYFYQKKTWVQNYKIHTHSANTPTPTPYKSEDGDWGMRRRLPSACGLRLPFPFSIHSILFHGTARARPDASATRGTPVGYLTHLANLASRRLGSL